MFIFGGTDSYESYNAAKKKAKLLAKEQGMELKVLDAKSLKYPQELDQYVQSISLFGTQNVVMLNRLYANSALPKYLVSKASAFAGSPIVAWHDDKFDKREALYKLGKKTDSLVEYTEPKAWDMSKWVSAKAKELELDMTNEVIQKLSLKAGTDKWLIVNELQKLKLLSELTNTKIGIEQYQELDSGDTYGDIWEMMDKLTAGSVSLAIDELGKMLQYDTSSAQYILVMLARQLDLISKVQECKTGGIDPKTLGIHPYVLEKLSKSAIRFDKARLKWLSQALLRLDMAIKQGGVDEFTGLMLYMLQWR